MSNSSQQSLFSRQIHPKIIAALSFVGLLLFTGVGRMAGVGGEEDAAFIPWMLAAAFLLVYSVFNSMLFISSTNSKEYVSQSFTWYLILAGVSCLFSYAVSGISINAAGSIKMIMIILTMGYIVFMAIMGTIKYLTLFFDREQEDKLSGKKRVKRRRPKRR